MILYKFLSKFATFTDFEESVLSFHKKNPTFLQKTQISELFEKC